MGFPRQEYWRGLPLPSLGDLPDSGIKPMSPALAGRFLTPESPGKPLFLSLSLCIISGTLGLIYSHYGYFSWAALPWAVPFLSLGLSSVVPDHHRKLPDNIEMLVLKFLELPTSLIFPQA